MKIKEPDLKLLIWNTISFTGEVDENEKPVSRTTFKKDLVRGIKQLKKAIRSSAEVGFVDEKLNGNAKESDISWAKVEGFEIPEGKVKHAERLTDIEIDLEDKMVAAFKHYYDELDGIP